MLTFLPLIAIVILLLVSAIMLGIRLSRPEFAYFWLVAALGALFVWPMILLMRMNIPQVIPLAFWMPEGFYRASPTLLVDQVSWSFALALATLALSAILTDVARAADADWQAWTSTLSLAALGLISVLAGNPLTLLLAWGAIDLVELIYLLGYLQESTDRARVVVIFSTRVLGIFLLLLAMILASSNNMILTFLGAPMGEETLPTIVILLLLAAGLRLGVLPLHRPSLKDLPSRRGLGTISRLVPTAASMVLLVRTAMFAVTLDITPYLLIFTALAAIYAGVSWLISSDELDGRPFWILGMASLALASALRLQPQAALALGIAVLFSGGLIFYASARNKFIFGLLVIGIINISSLPFTPAWGGGKLYSSPFSPVLIVFIVTQVLLMVGYLHHSLRAEEDLVGVERWVWVIYPWGLLLLPATHILIAWLGWLDSGIDLVEQINLISFLPSILAFGLIMVWELLESGGAWSLNQQQVVINTVNSIRSGFSLEWMYQFLWRVYQYAGDLLRVISRVLEGEGGVLWALLILALLVAFLLQGGLEAVIGEF